MGRVRESIESFVYTNNFSPDMTQRQILIDEAWENLIRSYVMLDLFEKHNISASMSEVMDTLLTNIPSIILNSPRLADNDGVFSMERYVSSLRTDRPEHLSWLRHFYRTTYIPYKKLQNAIISQRNVSEADMREYFNMKYNEADIELYIFDKHEVATEPVHVSDAEIQAFYQKNRLRYFVEPTVDLHWVLFPTAPSDDDRRQIAAHADSLYKEILNGRSFSNMARDFSAQPYARLHGMAGFLELDELEPAIRDKLIYAQSGDIIPPFLHDDAWWILKLDDKTVTMVRLNIIKLEIKPSITTLEQNRRNMERFVELSSRVGYIRTAEELRLTLHKETGLSLSNSNVDGIGDIAEIIRVCYTMPERTILSPIMASQLDTYIIFYIDRKTSGYFRSVFEMLDDIISELEKDKIRENFISMAERYRSSSLITRDHIQKTISFDDIETYHFDFIHEALNLNPGQYTRVFSDNDKAYFARVLRSRSLPHTPDFTAQIPLLRQELQNLFRDEYFEDWIETQRIRARVRDRRPANLFGG